MIANYICCVIIHVGLVFKYILRSSKGLGFSFKCKQHEVTDLCQDIQRSRCYINFAWYRVCRINDCYLGKKDFNNGLVNNEYGSFRLSHIEKILHADMWLDAYFNLWDRDTPAASYPHRHRNFVFRNSNKAFYWDRRLLMCSKTLLYRAFLHVPRPKNWLIRRNISSSAI